MRKQIIQARVTQTELDVIKEKATQSGMTTSDYLRTAAVDTQVQQIGDQREIACELCQMYTVVNQMEETAEKEFLLERMDQICRFLKS